MSTKSSFYSDTPNYANNYPTQNDTNTQPVNGNTKAPTSFYPNGGVYQQADPGAALNYATEAANSAAAALASQNAAHTSETNASSSASAASTSATNAATSASQAATSASNAATSESNAASSASNAYTNATSAQSSATSASTSASNASTSATNASNSATSASTSASNAATSATNASNSATQAANSASTAAASVQNAAGTVPPAMDGTAAVGTSSHWAHEDHVHPTDTSRAPLASPAFTGTPTAPTPASGDNSTKVSTTQFVQNAIAPLVGAVVYQGTWDANANSPALASGVGTKGYLYKVSVAGSTLIDGVSQWNVNDQIVFDGTKWDKIDGISAEVTSVAGRVGAVTLSVSDVSGAAPLASPAFTGAPSAPTPANADNSTKLATTAWVLANSVGLASPAFTGTPTAPTAAVGTHTTQLATTDFVQTAVDGEPAFRVHLVSSQALTASTTTTVAFDTVAEDSNSWWDATNKRYTPQKAGTYFFAAQITCSGTFSAGATLADAMIYKNGHAAGVSQGESFAYAQTAGIALLPCWCAMVQMNGTTDYVEVAINCGGTSPAVQGLPAPNIRNYFTGFRVRA